MTTMVTSADVSFVVRPRTDRFWQLFEAGAWEPWTLEVLRNRLGAGSHHVDIGAWVGVTVLVAAARGATVDAFEPDPAALGELEANLAANPDLARHVTIHPVALSATAGDRRLSRNQAGGDGMSSLARTSAAGIDVPVQAAADWLTRPEFIGAGLLKIDIEGGEYELLPAMRGYLAAGQPDLLLSLHAYHLFERLPGFARRGTARFLRNRFVTLRERSKVAWLGRLYPHIYVASGRDWQAIGRVTWLRLLHVPRDFDFFFSATPLGADGSSGPRRLKPWELWLG